MNARRSELVLVRHGETTGQSSIRLYGATDLPLSDIGEAQARAAGQALAPHTFAQVVTSPLQRAWRSAEYIAASPDRNRPLADAVRVEGLREIDFGDWEGWTVAEVQDRAPELHHRWLHDGDTFAFPGGEQRAAFRARVRAAVQASIARPCEDGPLRMLGVLHKGVMKIVIAELTGLDPAKAATLTINLASIHRLTYDGHRWSLTEHNRVDHLADGLHMADS